MVVVSNASVNVSTIVPCAQEEANTRIFLHMLNASISGSTTKLLQLWLWFGTGNKQRYIPIHSIAENFGSVKFTIISSISWMPSSIFICWTKKKESMEYTEVV